MALEEFKNTPPKDLPVAKLIAMISKGYTIYINHNLSDFEINSTQLQLLFEISNQSNINQEKISQICNINKGAVARSMKKLEDSGLVKRQIDENNRRQNMVSLTKKGEETLAEAVKISKSWEDKVILDDGYVKREVLQKVLKEIAIKTFELNQKEE